MSASGVKPIINFYKITPKSPSQHWYVTRCEGSKLSETTVVKCARGEITITKPILIKLKGRKPVEFIFGLGAFFIKQEIIDFLKADDFTGWKTFPVSIEGLPASAKYSGLAVTGRAGRSFADGSAYPIVPNFDPKKWDGNDFFALTDANGFYISERLYNALKKHGISCINYEMFTPTGSAKRASR